MLWGTFISEIGLTVPIKCIISTGVDEDTMLTMPPLALVSVIEPIVMLTATKRSDGESPRFTWSAVGFGWGLEFGELVPPPPQPMSENKNTIRRMHTVHLLFDDLIFVNSFMSSLQERELDYRSGVETSFHFRFTKGCDSDHKDQ